MKFMQRLLPRGAQRAHGAERIGDGWGEAAADWSQPASPSTSAHHHLPATSDPATSDPATSDPATSDPSGLAEAFEHDLAHELMLREVQEAEDALRRMTDDRDYWRAQLCHVGFDEAAARSFASRVTRGEGGCPISTLRAMSYPTLRAAAALIEQHLATGHSIPHAAHALYCAAAVHKFLEPEIALAPGPALVCPRAQEMQARAHLRALRAHARLNKVCYDRLMACDLDARELRARVERKRELNLLVATRSTLASVPPARWHSFGTSNMEEFEVRAIAHRMGQEPSGAAGVKFMRLLQSRVLTMPLDEKRMRRAMIMSTAWRLRGT